MLGWVGGKNKRRNKTTSTDAINHGIKVSPQYCTLFPQPVWLLYNCFGTPLIFVHIPYILIFSVGICNFLQSSHTRPLLSVKYELVYIPPEWLPQYQTCIKAFIILMEPIQDLLMYDLLSDFSALTALDTLMNTTFLLGIILISPLNYVDFSPYLSLRNPSSTL